MKVSELRTLYEEAVKIARKERAMRLAVFRNSPERQAEKVAEVDRLLEILQQIKDVAKEACEPDYEQPALLDVPKKAEYN